ncbi:carbohydrate binding domain-containing protein [Brevibacillus sp. NRS-1366]|uniref:carbohydrate binding domain-containing protein n=1 Tax=Brevibacillus sp. NRS-1366 TaxID=3233899 RepID=UPI003D21E991
MVSKFYWKCIVGVFMFFFVFSMDGSMYRANGESNLIINPDFEKEVGWEDWGGFSYTSDFKHIYSGNKSAMINKGEGGAGNAIIDNVTPGQIYTLSGFGKVSGQGQEGILGIECLDQEGKKIVGGKFTITFTNDEYLEKTKTFTTVEGTAKLRVYLYIITVVQDGAAYFDELSLKK